MKTFQESFLLVVFALAMLMTQNVFAQRTNARRPGAQRPKANRPNQRSQGADSSSAASAAAKLAVDSGSVIQSESALLVSTIEGSAVSKPGAGRRRTLATAFAAPYSAPTAAEVAMYIAEHASGRYQPANCLTSSVDGSTVKLAFNACTGPRGLRQLTGQLVEAVTVDASGIQVHANASALHIGETTMDIDSTSTLTNSNGTKSMSVMTSGAGTGPLGNSISRRGDYTTTWTNTCLTVNGSWQSASGEASRSTQVSNLTRCDDKCPGNGGTITHTYYAGVTITITFDGSAVAHWATTNGKSGTITLLCAP